MSECKSSQIVSKQLLHEAIAQSKTRNDKMITAIVATSPRWGPAVVQAAAFTLTAIILSN